MNPETVKHREYTGVALITLGVVLGLAALVGLFMQWPAALSSLIVGVTAVGSGIAVLASIPDLIDSADEW